MPERQPLPGIGRRRSASMATPPCSLADKPSPPVGSRARARCRRGSAGGGERGRGALPLGAVPLARSRQCAPLGGAGRRGAE